MFRRNDNVAYEKVQRQKYVVVSEENVFNVIGYLIEDPYTSQRKIRQETSSSLHRILNNYHEFL